MIASDWEPSGIRCGGILVPIGTVAKIAWWCFRESARRRGERGLKLWLGLSPAARRAWRMLAAQFLAEPELDAAAAWECWRRTFAELCPAFRLVAFERLPERTRRFWRDFVGLLVLEIQPLMSAEPCPTILSK